MSLFEDLKLNRQAKKLIKQADKTVKCLDIEIKTLDKTIKELIKISETGCAKMITKETDKKVYREQQRNQLIADRDAVEIAVKQVLFTNEPSIEDPISGESTDQERRDLKNKMAVLSNGLECYELRDYYPIKKRNRSTKN